MGGYLRRHGGGQCFFVVSYSPAIFCPGAGPPDIFRGGVVTQAPATRSGRWAGRRYAGGVVTLPRNAGTPFASTSGRAAVASRCDSGGDYLAAHPGDNAARHHQQLAGHFCRLVAHRNGEAQARAMEPAHKDPHQGPGRTPAPFRTRIAAFGLIGLSIPGVAIAGGLPAFTTGPAAGGGTEYSLSIQALIFMTVLVFLPAMLLMMTAFTRIIIVLSLLKQALGSTQMPPSQVIVGLSLFLTFFVMAPVFQKLNTEVLQPLTQNQINITQAMSRADGPLRTFMLSQTRPDDLALFVKLSGHPQLQAPADTPMTLLIPAFVTSELKTGFQIGFLIFIPFVIIDLVVAAVLMSMGMMMLSPVTVSFPFKLMLFVLVNGWDLVIGSLVQSFVH